MTSTEPVAYTGRQLFDEWLSGQMMIISETSHDLATDYEALIVRIRAAALFLALPWADDLVPEYVHDSIEARRHNE